MFLRALTGSLGPVRAFYKDMKIIEQQKKLDIGTILMTSFFSAYSFLIVNHQGLREGCVCLFILGLRVPPLGSRDSGFHAANRTVSLKNCDITE